MSRKILFRGKRVSNGEYVEGYYVGKIDCFADDNNIVCNKDGMAYAVITETVGQFTGKYDKKGNRIFENDIVKYNDKMYIIKYIENYTRFAVVSESEGVVMGIINFNLCEIIGNVFDNADLLEAGGNNQ